MIRSVHPVAEEELMAYLDGELPVSRARECAAHLAQCSECQTLAADLKGVYQQMCTWQVGAAPESVGRVVRQAIESEQQVRIVRRAWSERFGQTIRRPWVWALAGVPILVILVALSTPHMLRSPVAVRLASQPYADLNSYTAASASKPQMATNLEQLRQHADDSARQYQELAQRYAADQLSSSLENPPSEQQAIRESAAGQMQTLQEATPSGPMIARTASVNLVVKDFDKARTELDAILRRHNGYAAELKVDAPQDQVRSLTASLRVPAGQTDAALGELRKLGRVEQESQGGEEVTAQYVDLNARLSNARSTEQRLLQVLAQRTGKLADILSVEQEVSRVRGDIEQMEAERKSLERRVIYTSVDVQIREEYKAALEVTPPSEFAQMRNSLVEGVKSAVDGLLGIVRFLLYAGPMLLLWALILFFPLRFVWRRWRASASSKTAQTRATAN